jgi:hypothetical protein
VALSLKTAGLNGCACFFFLLAEGEVGDRREESMVTGVVRAIPRFVPAMVRP